MNIEQAMEVLECISLSDAITPEIDEAVTVVLDRLSRLINEPINVVMNSDAPACPGYTIDAGYTTGAQWPGSQSYQDYQAYFNRSLNNLANLNNLTNP